jgi:hypothetical protein
MKALTVQQPWAWAIVHGGKDIENRTQAWSYRGPLAIHAGARLSDRGCDLVPELLDLTRPDLLAEYADTTMTYGAIVGVVDLVDVHPAVGDDLAVCCSSVWGETSYAEHGGRTRREVIHMELTNARAVDPIPCKGRLGLWTPPADVLAALADQLVGVQ